MKEIIKKLSGKVLGIGLEEDLKKVILENDNIVECDLLSDGKSESKSQKGKKKKTKNKKINIRKIRKKYRKKVDYIIVEASTIDKYRKTFVKDSIIITRKCIYLYGDYDFDNLIARYKRSASVTKITNMKYKKNTLYKIDVSGIKKGRVRLNSFIDNMLEVSNNISDFLIS